MHHRPTVLGLLFGLLWLFLVQAITVLIESIYVLDLLNTRLDEKAAGVLFLFTPLLLVAFRKDAPAWLVGLALGLLAVGRAALPYLPTAGRLLAAGVAAGAALILLPVWLRRYLAAAPWTPAVGLALAVAASTLLRALNHSLDVSLGVEAGWLGALLALALIGLHRQVERQPPPTPVGAGPAASGSGVWAAAGLLAVLALVYFAFASPAVIARWTEGNYAAITAAVSLLAVLWVAAARLRPQWLLQPPPVGLAVWNVAFVVALVVLIVSHTVRFPLVPETVVVVERGVSATQTLLLGLMLALHPVIYTNAAVLSAVIARRQPSVRQLAGGAALGMLFLVLLVFMLIFTNVWGYVQPVSGWFRNRFWLPFLLAGSAAGLAALAGAREARRAGAQPAAAFSGLLLGLLAGMLVVTLAAVLLPTRLPETPAAPDGLIVMTYNLQQANDAAGERAYRRQIEVIRNLSPDIVALQESDATRIGLGNNDYVRYYAEKLGYHVYYGPKTVTGTYGTALLSRYPITAARTLFSYSDQDEIGTVEAEIQVGDRAFTIYNVHPDGSDTAMLAFARILLERSRGRPHVIALGDYNLRESEAAYQQIAAVYASAWLAAHPSGVDASGVDLSGDRRIDHIFLGPEFNVLFADYLLPPESATDHPVHSAGLRWR